MIDPEAVVDARKRLPNAAEDRPEEVDKALADREVVGYEREKALAGDYDRYPEDPADVLSPEYGEVLREVANHSETESPNDVAEELGVSEELITKASSLHGVTLPDGEDDDSDSVTLNLPLGNDVPVEYVGEPVYEDARVLHHLVVTCGLAADEVVTFIERQMNDGRDDTKPPYSVSRQEVVNALKRHNLMNGEPNDIDDEAVIERGHKTSSTVTVQ